MLQSRWKAKGCALRGAALLRDSGFGPNSATLRALDVLRREGMDICIQRGVQLDLHPDLELNFGYRYPCVVTYPVLAKLTTSYSDVNLRPPGHANASGRSAGGGDSGNRLEGRGRSGARGTVGIGRGEVVFKLSQDVLRSDSVELKYCVTSSMAEGSKG
ncbi:hypothetical protein C8R44DRAFT_744884 [Mycena epipterygia]|nr:hypothetical protein C8R44DRAFT_744884 [Mycena epipterygia]